MIANGISQPMNRAGSVNHNSFGTAFRATLEKEQVGPRNWRTEDEIKNAVFEFIAGSYKRK